MKKEVKIGILAVVVLLAGIAVINFLRGKDVLGRRVELIGYFDDVQTLVASAPVQIRGFAAGRVDDVEYDGQKNMFKVTCSVDKQFNIPVDSRMNLFSTSIMGGKGIRIDFGQAQEYARNGAVLQTGADADMIGSLLGGFDPVAKKLSAALDSVSALAGSINSLVNEKNKAEIANALKQVNSTLASARHMMAELDGKSDEISSIIDNIDSLSAILAPIVKNAGESIDLTVDNLDSLVNNVNSEINDVKIPLNRLLESADSLVNAVKNNPKRYLKISVF